MHDLVASLQTVGAALKRLQRTVVLDSLLPGVSPERTASAINALGLRTSEPLQALHSWRDGTNTAETKALGDIYFFPGFYFFSLADAVKAYQSAVKDDRWDTSWFPLFADGGGDFYVMDLDTRQGEIRHFRNEELEQPVEYLSLNDMMATIAASFERDVFFVDGEGYLEMNDLAYAAVAADMNPRVTWWTEPIESDQS